MKVLVRIKRSNDLIARYTYDDLEIREDSEGKKWLAFIDGPESMPLNMVPDAIEKGGWYAQAGGMGCAEEFITADELQRVLEVVRLTDLRDCLTDALEEIGMFDEGRAGDTACAVLKEVGCWSRTMERVDGKPVGFFPHRAHRGSDVEAFIKRARDAHFGENISGSEAWHALDRLLDDYRLHGDTGTPLTEPTPVDGGDMGART